VNRNVVAQTATTATNAESNARSFRSSNWERSHQPSYECKLVMVAALAHAHRDHCDLDHTARSLRRNPFFASAANSARADPMLWPAARSRGRLPNAHISRG
jgi:hypothetical protein